MGPLEQFLRSSSETLVWLGPNAGTGDTSVSRQKLRAANTDLDNLVGNLRGEVGEVITTWVMMRHFMAESARLASGDPAKDLADRDLAFVNLLAEKLRNELVSRLSELAESKIGRLTFYFAARKLGRLEGGAAAFEAYFVGHRLREKRNRDISHKELPEKWSDHRNLHIPYRVLVKAVAQALRPMKRIDRHVLGPSAPYSWREARKRRYNFMSPPRAGYVLLPYLRLSVSDRIRILEEELREVREALANGDDDAFRDEIGDLLFAAVNLSRFHHTNAEQALDQTVTKFIHRFEEVERRVREEGRALADCTLDEMDAHWERAKQLERDA